MTDQEWQEVSMVAALRYYRALMAKPSQAREFRELSTASSREFKGRKAERYAAEVEEAKRVFGGVSVDTGEDSERGVPGSLENAGRGGDSTDVSETETGTPD